MRKIRKQCPECQEFINKYDYTLCLISGKMDWRQTKQSCKDFNLSKPVAKEKEDE